MSAHVTLGQLRDAAGYIDTGDYGVIGDGRSVALVAKDGAVDWWGVPQIDSVPPFAAVLDPGRGGRFVLAPVDRDAAVTWRYLPHTNQLETTYTTESGQARVLDGLNSGNAGPLPWVELARRIDGVSGTVEFEVLVELGDGLGGWQPWVIDDPRGVVLHAGELTMGLRTSDDVSFKLGRADGRGRVTVAEGQRSTVALVASYDEPLFLADIPAIHDRIDYTTESWRRWSSQVEWTGAGRERIVRSALALKLLMVRGGAIAAAATTSLPEKVGGDKNWDYRYSWIRDAALTIDAMSLCGLQEEVHAATAWLLRAIRENGPAMHVMYTLDGDVAGGSTQPDVPGYRGSLPVLVGNDATGQLQLGIYGDLFQTVQHWVYSGHVLDVGTARELADLADSCADQWLLRDAGIWELHTDHHYTSSKMNCWRALACAVQLAEGGHIAGAIERWRNEADRIRAWVQEHCWSETKRAYTFYAGTDDLDASVLLGAQFGFDTGERMSSTVDAIRLELGSELGAGPLLYRYTGVDREEATFTACAYWAVEALARTGRHGDAETLMHELDELTSNDLGLMSEMTLPGATGNAASVGNTPQALSHLASITAAFALKSAGGNPFRAA